MLTKSGSIQKNRGISNIKTIITVLADIFFVNFSSFLALYIRLDFSLTELINSGFLRCALYFAPINTVITIAVFILFKLYRGIWKFAGIDEFITIAGACVVSSTVSYAALIILQKIFKWTFPRSYPLIYFILLLAFITFLRFSYRFASKVKSMLRTNKTDVPENRVMIIGAGRSGATVLREMQTSSHSDGSVVCMLDKDPAKIGKYIHGVEVVGNCDDIPSFVEKYKINEIILAIPTATYAEKREIIDSCQNTKCSLRIVPALYQLANGEVNIEKVRDVRIEDLLGRDSVKVDMTEISEILNGKVVLVTGGGGSIGSELCRQIAKHSPKTLIIFDIYENNAYSIEQELIAKFPDLDLRVVIGSVRDARRVESVIFSFKPDIIYHAAAHKHVPLMENSPNEAVKNNVFGTYNVAKSAHKAKIKTFVLISTDKAVNPTNIMGATKRLCEMIIESFDKISPTKFVAVRFGNVLGSNGSVIPLFTKQIENGGPVTVTHKDVVRYFMTIPEAVSLVLQAGCYARGGEIFVLDMGQPVKIDDLARKMIKLSGFEPDVDIKIEYTGLRPGEKLYEELLTSEEGLTKTENNLIYKAKLSDVNVDEFFESIAYLRDMCYDDDIDIRYAVKKIVKTYKIPEESESDVQNYKKTS